MSCLLFRSNGDAGESGDKLHPLVRTMAGVPGTPRSAALLIYELCHLNVMSNTFKWRMGTTERICRKFVSVLVKPTWTMGETQFSEIQRLCS